VAGRFAVGSSWRPDNVIGVVVPISGNLASSSEKGDVRGYFVFGPPVFPSRVSYLPRCSKKLANEKAHNLIFDGLTLVT
jgi:hypothetical protein